MHMVRLEVPGVLERSYNSSTYSADEWRSAWSVQMEFVMWHIL